jgi:hypothetical protein
MGGSYRPALPPVVVTAQPTPEMADHILAAVRAR